eukprot:CAMPEP_0194354228 /NCGR_PEP_ID=MMETSP0174-20130528/2430_1 /TAXON_ID=216777 /ORGANISM="Proboscia alata, Strain PI-D3" /LENGTH=371 /DNA_ID=CAMNT_0039123101 /DNA_START=139 /DNA_END=1254 /DNA_ORIENTATION=-
MTGGFVTSSSSSSSSSTTTTLSTIKDDDNNDNDNEKDNYFIYSTMNVNYDCSTKASSTGQHEPTAVKKEVRAATARKKKRRRHRKTDNHKQKNEWKQCKSASFWKSVLCAPSFLLATEERARMAVFHEHDYFDGGPKSSRREGAVDASDRDGVHRQKRWPHNSTTTPKKPTTTRRRRRGQVSTPSKVSASNEEEHHQNMHIVLPFKTPPQRSNMITDDYYNVDDTSPITAATETTTSSLSSDASPISDALRLQCDINYHNSHLKETPFPNQEKELIGRSVSNSSVYYSRNSSSSFLKCLTEPTLRQIKNGIHEKVTMISGGQSKRDDNKDMNDNKNGKHRIGSNNNIESREDLEVEDMIIDEQNDDGYFFG